MVRLLRLLVLLTGSSIGSAGCLEPSQGPNSPGRLGFPEGGTRVLLIGNSLTYFNDLPGMLKAVAKQAGDNSIDAAAVAFPDYALEDHWNEGTARRALTDAKWEFVVMQQGPSSLPQNQIFLAEWSAKFAPLIRAAGAVPMMYMVWPTIQRQQDFPAVLVSYRNAAAGIGGIFAPVGDAWIAGFAADAQLPLYGVDGLHPSVLGTYVAAIVILERIKGIDPTSLPATIPGAVGVSVEMIRAAQQAAKIALARNPARPTAQASSR